MQQLYPFISSINKQTKDGEIQFQFCKRKTNIGVCKNYWFTYDYKCAIYF